MGNLVRSNTILGIAWELLGLIWTTEDCGLAHAFTSQACPENNGVCNSGPKDWNVGSEEQNNNNINIGRKLCVIWKKCSELTVNHKIGSLGATKLNVEFPNRLCGPIAQNLLPTFDNCRAPNSKLSVRRLLLLSRLPSHFPSFSECFHSKTNLSSVLLSFARNAIIMKSIEMPSVSENSAFCTKMPITNECHEICFKINKHLPMNWQIIAAAPQQGNRIFSWESDQKCVTPTKGNCTFSKRQVQL